MSLLTSEAPLVIARLEELGARFDRRADTGYELSREAAHGRARVLHAGGDATGVELVRTLVQAVEREPAIQVIEQSDALELLVEKGRVVGVIVRYCPWSYRPPPGPGRRACQRWAGPAFLPHHERAGVDRYRTGHGRASRSAAG